MRKRSKLGELTQKQLEVKQLLEEGLSVRQIATKVLERSSQESTIRHWISKGLFDEETVVVKNDDNTELSDDELEAACNSVNWDIANLAKRLRTTQRALNQHRKVQRAIFDNKPFESILEGIEKATESINVKSKTLPLEYYDRGSDAKDATLEVLLSDLQIGKVSRHYNTEVAKKALENYGKGILQLILDRRHLYNVEHIVVGLVGDLVEDHLKHGVQSATACDTGLSEQIHDAIEGIWEHIIYPLSQLGIKMDVMCVTGNHGSSQHKGMDSFKAGRFSYDYVIHKTLERYCTLMKMDNVTFHIPDGTFGSLSIYGKHAIYEHGYHNPCSEKGMTDQMRKRGSQLKIHPSYWRQGDRHHHACFGQGELVLNAAFFGVEQEGIEYSGILGFDSIPTQTCMIHVDDKRLGHGNIKEVVNIQVTPDGV